MVQTTLALSAGMLLMFAAQAAADPDHRAIKEKICIQDAIYRDVSFTLQQAKAAYGARNIGSALKLLDAGEKRLRSYETENHLSSYRHPPASMVLDDRGLYCMARSQFEKDRFARAANANACLLRADLDDACDEISYKLGYRGAR